MTLRRPLLAILVLALAPFACERARLADRVLLITLDTTRADRLSSYGFTDVTLPHLERIARDGVVFDRAASVAPLTLPAHTSLFTGLLPPRHGVRDNSDRPLADAHVTLAEMLHARGFRTAAFVGSTVVDPDRGLQQGFDVYAAAGGRQRRGDRVVDDAIRWLERSAQAPFLMWVHLYDPHRPYDPPEPFASTYAHDPYLGEIAFADSQVGRLLDALQRLRVFERTVIVVAGDHGESLGEHGERDHGLQLYEGVLRVPLLIRAPGLAPARIGEVVRLIDVTPTILELVGATVPQTNGVSLVPLMRGTARDLDLEAYAESMYAMRFGLEARRSIRVGRYKLIETPALELYDLEADPFEQRNIHAHHRMIAQAMSARLAALAGAPGLAAPRTTTIPPELLERLGALGYLGTGAMPPVQR